jgi:hypothetical protein
VIVFLRLSLASKYIHNIINLLKGITMSIFLNNLTKSGEIFNAYSKHNDKPESEKHYIRSFDLDDEDFILFEKAYLRPLYFEVYGEVDSYESKFDNALDLVSPDKPVFWDQVKLDNQYYRIFVSQITDNKSGEIKTLATIQRCQTEFPTYQISVVRNAVKTLDLETM